VGMPYQLSGLISGIGKTEPINHAVQPPFEEDKQVLPRNPLLPLCLLEIGAKLSFKNSVDPLYLLFLPQLTPIFRKLAPRFPVLARGVRPPVDGALIGITPVALKKELEVFRPTEPALRTYVSSQNTPP
jgi:hypothetical protein